MGIDFKSINELMNFDSPNEKIDITEPAFKPVLKEILSVDGTYLIIVKGTKYIWSIRNRGEKEYTPCWYYRKQWAAANNDSAYERRSAAELTRQLDMLKKELAFNTPNWYEELRKFPTRVFNRKYDLHKTILLKIIYNIEPNVIIAPYESKKKRENSFDEYL